MFSRSPVNKLSGIFRLLSNKQKNSRQFYKNAQSFPEGRGSVIA